MSRPNYEKYIQQITDAKQNVKEIVRKCITKNTYGPHSKNVFNYSKGTGASTYFLKEMKLAYGSNSEDFIKTNKKELFEAIKYDSNADMIYIRSVDTDDLWEELIDRSFIFLVQDLNTREFFAFYDKVNAMKFVVENYAREGKKENKDFNIKNFRYHL